MGIVALLLLIQLPPLMERVEVRQVVLQVRAVTHDGAPLLGLSPKNFLVLVDGNEVALTSAEWVERGAEAFSSTALAEASRPGRLMTVLVQRDLQPARARGLIAFKGYMARVIQQLPPNDLVALLFHDSHLRLIQDFTHEHRRVIDILTSQVFRAHRPEPADPQVPALAPLLSVAKQKAAVTREEGLLALAEALALLPGEKHLVVLGWGFGRLSYPSFFLSPTYFQAVRLLEDQHIPVFALDITQADAHTLELGLVKVAEDTGGFYAKTHLFPQTALKRLIGALAGYYELSFPRPPLPEGVHGVEIRLLGADGLVLYKKTFADPPREGVP